jgi:hypothetical protein
MGLAAAVTGWQGLLTVPRHLIPASGIPRGQCLPYSLICISYTGLMRLIIVRGLCHSMQVIMRFHYMDRMPFHAGDNEVSLHGHGNLNFVE